MAFLHLLLLLALPLLSHSFLPRDVISGKVIVLAPQPNKDGTPSVTLGARAAAALAAPFSGQDTAARVVLDGGLHEVYASTFDGSFSFEGVPPGVHTVEVFHRDLLYPTFRVEIPEPGSPPLEDAVGKYPYLGAYRLAAKLPLEIAPVALPQHFEDRPPSSLWGLARSPMVWMCGLMLVLMLLMKGVDPEEMKCVTQPPPPPHLAHHAHARTHTTA
jgi:hypothetical protein